MSFFTDLFAAIGRLFGPVDPIRDVPVNWDTAGPPHDEHPPVPVSALLDASNEEWTEGWWSVARRVPCHTGRLGVAIAPKGYVTHTTDCYPGTMAGILERWSKEKGAGNAAHFMLGRKPSSMNEHGVTVDGLVQMASIVRNANHAGGSNGHGWLKTAAGALVHPNTFYVGIEVDNAGLLVKKGDRWIHKDSGGVIATSDVYIDKNNRGWHKITDYQFDMLGRLHDALETVIGATPLNMSLVPNGDYKANGMPWAGQWTVHGIQEVRRVGHITLDPNNKTDPGVQLTSWIRSRYGLDDYP